MIISLYRTLGIILHTARADYDLCGDVFHSTKYFLEKFGALLCPTRSMGTVECRHPCGALVYIYIYIYLL